MNVIRFAIKRFAFMGRHTGRRPFVLFFRSGNIIEQGGIYV